MPDIDLTHAGVALVLVFTAITGLTITLAVHALLRAHKEPRSSWRKKY